MKKFLTIMLALAISVSIATVFTACGSHEHSFSKDWSKDAVNHWHACTGEDCTETSDLTAHDFTVKYTADYSKEYTECSVCGYKTEEVVHNHTGGTATHTERAVCTVCEQEYGEVLGVAKVNGVGYDTLESAVNATGTTDIVTVLVDGEYELPTQAMQNKNITFIGEQGVVFDCSSLSTLHTQAATGATIKFKNVTLKFNDTTHYQGLAHTEKVIYEDCVINGQQCLYSDSEFINCTFVNYNDYSVWTWGSTNATFTDCVFESGGKALLVYTETESSVTVVLNNCEFKDNDTLSAVKAAVEVGSNPSNSETVFNITMNSCSVTGFAVNDAGINTGTNFYGNKNSIDENHLHVIIN